MLRQAVAAASRDKLDKARETLLGLSCQSGTHETVVPFICMYCCSAPRCHVAVARRQERRAEAALELQPSDRQRESVTPGFVSSNVKSRLPQAALKL